MHPLNDKESFDRQVAVPDNDVLREQQIYPEHRESEDHLAKVVHDGWIREQVVLAQTTAQHDRGEGHRGQSTPEAPGEKILPTEMARTPRRADTASNRPTLPASDRTTPTRPPRLAQRQGRTAD